MRQVKKFLFLWCIVIGSVYAQTTETSDNLITSGANHTWQGVVTNSTHSPGVGPLPVYVPAQNYIVFGYDERTVSQVIGINTALAQSGSGIQISGVRYGWNYFNTGSNSGTLSANVGITSSAGNSLYSYSHNMPQNNGWTAFSQVQSFGSLYDLTALGNATVSFTGVDYRNANSQDRYYGPAVQNVSLRFDYTVAPIDPCVSDPLYSPSCSGYQQAYHDQQCAANPLYATSCPGYQSAYYSQQCSINPLYDSGCPGYQQAYFNQQCSLDSLYSPQCPGYATAFFNQQCSLDGLYDRQCSNYAEAYAKKNLLNPPASVTTVATVSTTEPSIQIGDDGKVNIDVPLVSDPVVNTIVTKKTETKKEESKEETKPVAENKTESKPQAKRAPPKVDPATQTASEKEFEKEIANQNQAITAISLVPGFSAYQNSIVPDLMGAQMQSQYNKPNVDNARLMRQLNGASDRLHNDMIQQQYR